MFSTGIDVIESDRFFFKRYRRMRKSLAVAFGLFLAAAPALAQDKPFELNLGGGFTLPTGDFKNHDVWGPDFPAAAGGLVATSTGRTSFTSNAAYFPLTFGVRF